MQEIRTSRRTLHIDCSAPGTYRGDLEKIFDGRKINIGWFLLPPPGFNSAVIAALELLHPEWVFLGGIIKKFKCVKVKPCFLRASLIFESSGTRRRRTMCVSRTIRQMFLLISSSSSSTTWPTPWRSEQSWARSGGSGGGPTSCTTWTSYLLPSCSGCSQPRQNLSQRSSHSGLRTTLQPHWEHPESTCRAVPWSAGRNFCHKTRKLDTNNKLFSTF